MTAQEKAKDIFDKFAFEKTTEGYKMFQTLNESKRCSLIVVSEIINNIDKSLIHSDIEEWWQEVKEEIQKL